MCLWFPTSYGRYMWNCMCDSQPLQFPCTKLSSQCCFTSAKARPVPHRLFLQYQLLEQQQKFWKRNSSYYKITKSLKLRSFHTFRWLVCSNLCNRGCLLVYGSSISYRERLFSCPGQLNRWPCHSLSESVSQSGHFWFLRLQSTTELL